MTVVFRLENEYRIVCSGDCTSYSKMHREILWRSLVGWSDFNRAARTAQLVVWGARAMIELASALGQSAKVA